MVENESVTAKMREHYDRVWSETDPWGFEHSAFEQARYERQISLLANRRYERVLEVGCGAGRFTRLLAGISNSVVAVDVAPKAIDRAAGEDAGVIDFRAADIMKFDLAAEGPWDLVVMSETIYCLGWLYPFFDVSWLARELFSTSRDGGRLLLANTYGGENDHLLSPWLIHTYRDLFRNVGFDLESEEIFQGVKDGVEMKVLMSRFVKSTGSSPETQ
jgi:SAM-dependent methyltransferase